MVSTDPEAFLRDVMALRSELVKELGEEDLSHMKRMERIGKIATAVGLATAPWFPNPLSAAALALGRSTRWLMMHHIGHRGYDKVPNVPEKYTSKVFARGKRRFLDWPDWMTAEAWCYEHNALHHSYTGEEADPDLVERNTEDMRDPRIPKAARYAIVGLLAATWRASYYAPKTTGMLLERKLKRKPTNRELYTVLAKDTYLPYVGWHFVGLPLLFAPLGPLAMGSALANSVMADVLTNIHTFLVVGPNHSGDDLERYDGPPKTRAEGMVRQVKGSVNYATGDDVTDFLHLWLNYQIEHHLFPDLPMLAYQRMQPKVRALCEKHGIPYIQESVWKRFGKLVDIIVGNTQMKRVPHEADVKDDEADRPIEFEVEAAAAISASA